MDIKDILLLVRPGDDGGSAAAVAGRLAKTHGAHVSALCLTPLPSLDSADCYAIGAAAVHEVMIRLDHEVELLAAAAETPVRTALAAAACDFDWAHTPPGESAAETALRARVHDLVVIARPAARQGAARRAAEVMLRLGGAPCLLVPPAASEFAFARVALAWNGSREAKRAMDDAMPILARAEAVDVLVADEPAHRPWSSDAVIEHLVRHGVRARLVRLSPNGGDWALALIDYCRREGADLLVMGAFGRTPQAEHWLGGVTWTILTTASLPILMSH
jgi:nucleotide-binding universal stress UspA family protein